MEKEYRFALLGHPVAHSSSAIIHGALGEIKNIKLTYELCDREPRQLDDFFNEALEKYDGFNVTVPYKQDIMDYVAEIDADALRIGAVNTCLRTQNGFAGFNTDVYGVSESLKEAEVNIQGKECVVLGAGGAARSVVSYLISNNASKIYIVNRSRERALALVEDFEVYGEFQKTVPQMADLSTLSSADKAYYVFNATSLGLKKDDASPVSKEFIPQIAFAMDLIPIKEDTAFLRDFKASNVKCQSGMKMLMHQAIRAFELWTQTVVTESEKERLWKMINA